MSTKTHPQHRFDARSLASQKPGHRVQDHLLLGGAQDLALREALRELSGVALGSAAQQDAFVAALCCRAGSS